ncbi:hypothetical protein ABOM_007327 [Aspergillus bombycis]|uniref:Uncharacterized protein n=1 Tax=Aspergillus bombycis TaxID=109264 RepID=A0A1F7ZX91_9EURO|nr:hypothetical protein ABOM_007327 [Aspergillus bombycis]OGM44060.1 hypothetical protein ABOM_007327 [Aspergillus bombycis]
MEITTLAAMMRQQFDGLNQNINQRVDNLQESLNTRVDNLQRTLFQQNNELHDTLTRRIDETMDSQLEEPLVQRSQQLEESLVHRSNQLEESLVQRSNQIHQAMLQRTNELDTTLIQRNNEFQQTLTRRIDETLLQRSNELQGFLAQRLDDTTAQRTEALHKNLVQEMVKFHKGIIRPQFHRVQKDLAARDQDIKREFQSFKERFDRVDAKFHTLEMDMKEEFNNVNKRFTHMENRFDRVETKVDRLGVRVEEVDAKVDQLGVRVEGVEAKVDQLGARMEGVEAKVDQLEARMSRVEAKADRFEDRLDRVETKVDRFEVQMGNFERILRNSKIAFLSQRVLPIQMYDQEGSPMPIPAASLPTTALAFYHLKESKHWSKLRSLIEYYRLQEEAIQATADYDGSFADTKLEYTELELERAISSNAWGVFVVLGGRIGIDCGALHDRVIQVQFHSQKNVSSKRDASDLSTNKRAAKTHCPLSDRVRPVSEAQRDTDVCEPYDLSRIYSEVDSEKFKQSLDPRIQGNEPLVTPVPKQGLNGSCSSQGEQREYVLKGGSSYSLFYGDTEITMSLSQQTETESVQE